MSDLIKRLRVGVLGEADTYGGAVYAAKSVMNEAANALERMQWQPIETAPRDGTEILACCVGNYDSLLIRWISPIEFLNESEQRDSEMDEEELEQEDWFYADFIQGGRLQNDIYPTKWMHLPPEGDE